MQSDDWTLPRVKISKAFFSLLYKARYLRPRPIHPELRAFAPANNNPVAAGQCYTLFFHEWKSPNEPFPFPVAEA